MKKPIKRSTFIVILSIFFGVIIVVKALNLAILNFLTAFLYLFFIIPFIVIAAIFIIIILILLLKNKQWLIAVVTMVLCVAIILLPIDSYFESIRFFVLKNKMEQTAQHVIEGDYGTITSENRTIILPEVLQNLSRGGGEVMVVHNSQVYAVIFFVDRGILGSFKGYVYVTGYGAKSLLDSYAYNWTDVRKINENWYYYAASD